jgi:hypothetical protein
MKTKFLCAIALLLPQAVFAATIAGALVEGGGIDDMHVVVKGVGKEISAFCDQLCGDLFYTGKHDVAYLKKNLRGKKVTLTYREENNKGRIAGPGEDERLIFVKKLEFVR